MKLFDSNIIIYSAQSAYAWLRPWWQEGGYVSEVTWVETLGYQHIHPDDKAFYQQAFRVLEPVPITRDVVLRAIALRQQRKMKLGDSLIAATALLKRVPVVTRNERDFIGIPDLVVENPFAANPPLSVAP